MAYTTATLLDEVDLKLERNPRFTTALRLKGLNRGLVDLARFVAENWKVDNVLNPLDPVDTNYYAMEFPLPSDAIFVSTVSFNGLKLRKLTQPEFVGTGAEFDIDNTGSNPAPVSLAMSPGPTGYYIRANQFLNLWPRPTTQKTVQIYYLAVPAELTNAADEVPELSAAYSDCLIFYACYWATLGVPGQQERTAVFRALYLEERARVKFDQSQNAEHKIGRAK